MNLMVNYNKNLIKTLVVIVIMGFVISILWGGPLNLSSQPNQAPTLTITPLKALAGEPWCIKVAGLTPNSVAKLIVEFKDAFGVVWESSAVFTVTDRGTVEPDIQAPNSGSYQGVDPSGLFWSTRPVNTNQTSGAFSKSIEPQRLMVSVEVEGKRILSQTIERLFLLPGVERQVVDEAEVKGILFLPAQQEPRPAIIVLSGSEGGVYEPPAAIYASQGFVTLALAYFGQEGLPDELVHIPIETVDKAVEWLENHPRVNKDAIGIWGASKGAELALLAAAHNPKIKAVVAKSPSAVAFEGVSKAMGIDHKSSWTLNGEEVPFVPIVFNQQLSDSFFSSKLANEPWSTAPMYAYALENKEAVDAATIQVEKINGPILLVSGSEDGVWPAETMAKAIMDRLKAKGHPFPDMHLNYEGAGHQIGAPYSPTTINWLTVSGGLVEDLGGSPQRNAAAALDSWTKITVFLQEHLR